MYRAVMVYICTAPRAPGVRDGPVCTDCTPLIPSWSATRTDNSDEATFLELSRLGISIAGFSSFSPIGSQ